MPDSNRYEIIYLLVIANGQAIKITSDIQTELSEIELQMQWYDCGKSYFYQIWYPAGTASPVSQWEISILKV